MRVDEVILIGVGVVFVWVFWDWLWEGVRRRREVGQLRERSRKCHLCGRRYEEKSLVRISKCPECAAVNEKKGHRSLG